MSKTSKRRSRRMSRGTVDRSATTDVMTQLECAIRNPQAAAIGAVLGGLVPWLGRTLAHGELPGAWSDGSRGIAMAMLAVVLGCACFSALSVYKFGRAAFGDARKALGFVLAIEGVMLLSHGTASTVALVMLIVINALANGSVIALARDATRRRCEADARRSATRARSRGHAAAPAPIAHVPAIPAVPPPIPYAAYARVPARNVPSMAMTVRRRSSLADAIDAEIVSESVVSN